MTPNDDEFARLYGLNNVGQDFAPGRRGTQNADIDAPEAWDDTTGSSDVKVAVVDTGDRPAPTPTSLPNLDSEAGRDFFADGTPTPRTRTATGPTSRAPSERRATTTQASPGSTGTRA
ncbi:MAG: hypothetical protein WKF31_10800 [Thermoleophilaceae bacterium]